MIISHDPWPPLPASRLRREPGALSGGSRLPRIEAPILRLFPSSTPSLTPPIHPDITPSNRYRNSPPRPSSTGARRVTRVFASYHWGASDGKSASPLAPRSRSPTSSSHPCPRSTPPNAPLPFLPKITILTTPSHAARTPAHLVRKVPSASRLTAQPDLSDLSDLFRNSQLGAPCAITARKITNLTTPVPHRAHSVPKSRANRAALSADSPREANSADSPPRIPIRTTLKHALVSGVHNLQNLQNSPSAQWVPSVPSTAPPPGFPVAAE
jgi:hypothetical protein